MHTLQRYPDGPILPHRRHRPCQCEDRPYQHRLKHGLPDPLRTVGFDGLAVPEVLEMDRFGPTGSYKQAEAGSLPSLQNAQYLPKASINAKVPIAVESSSLQVGLIQGADSAAAKAP